MQESTLKALRGMSDIYTPDIESWQHVEKTLSQCAQQFGFKEIRTPLLESIDVFTKLGDESDVVGKQMYSFQDQKGQTIALRPEGTASLVRAGLEHHLFTRESAKLFYCGPMFRYERPQKGRYRQFHQFGVEIFGHDCPSIDVELLQLNQYMYDQLGISGTQLEINYLGSLESRNNYKKHLVSYLSQHKDDLDEDSKRRLTTNPLRILDSKNERTKDICANAPILRDSLTREECAYFDTVCRLLQDCGLSYVINDRLVRGLDYYSDLVFEFTSGHLGAQSAVSAGGRFDTFIKSVSHAHDIPAIGFSIGLERLILMCQHEPKHLNTIRAVSLTGTHAAEALNLLQSLRPYLPSWQMTYAHKQASLKAHLKKAAKDNTDMLIIFDEAGVQIKAKNYLKEDVHTTLQEASSHILQILGPFHE